MRLLLDSHTVLWWFFDDRRLPKHVADAIGDPANEKSVSAASAYEISYKFARGQLPDAEVVAAQFVNAVRQEGFSALPISLEDAERAGRLGPAVRDPFDRLLIAQAIAGDYVLISNERSFDKYGVRRLW